MKSIEQEVEAFYAEYLPHLELSEGYGFSLEALQQFAIDFHQSMLDKQWVSVERTGTIHELKTWPQFYEDVASGKKTFEVRNNDRQFKVGDVLRLIEYNPDSSVYGVSSDYLVTYILPGGEFGISDEYVCMSIQPLPQPPKE